MIHNNGYLDIKSNNRVYYNQGVQTACQTQFETGSLKHQMIIGARLHQDAFDRFQWVDKYQMQNGVLGVIDRGTQGTESNRLQNATALAAYIQYELAYKKWRFIPGMRYENITFNKQDYGKVDTERTGQDLKETENKNQIFLPGLGISYAWNKHLNLIFGAHKGFSPSGFTEDALPEQSTNYEIGGKYLKGTSQLAIIGFYSDYANLLGADNLSAGGSGSGDLFNGGQARAMGVEFLASYDLLQKNKNQRLPIGATYTYTKAMFLNSFESDFAGWGSVQEHDLLPYLPQHQIGFNIGYELEKLGIFYNYKYQSEMYAVAGTSALPNEFVMPAFSVSDISVNYDLRTRVQLFGSVMNIMNTKYIAAMRPAGLRPGMPRAFRLGVKVKL